LNFDRTIHGIGDFSDGELIAICLQNMFVLMSLRRNKNWFWCLPNWSSDGNHFDENWLAKIRTDVGENTRIKVMKQEKIDWIRCFSF